MYSPQAAAFRQQHGYEISGNLTGDVLAVLAQAHDGRATLREIAEHLNVRPSTISRVVSMLQHEHHLIDTASAAPVARRGTTGRAPRPVQLSDQQALLGFSIADITDLGDRSALDDPRRHPGPNAIVSRLVGHATSLSGHALCEPVYFPLSLDALQDSSGKKLADAIHAAAQDLRNKIAPRTVISIGLGLGGVVHDGVANRSCNLAWKGPVQIETALREVFPALTIAVDNDTNLLALASGWRGTTPPTVHTLYDITEPAPRNEAKGPRTLVVILVRPEGIGAGVYTGGQRIAGSRGAAGEIGHVKIAAAEGLRCRCGSTGCLEALAAPNRIADRLITKFASDGSASSSSARPSNTSPALLTETAHGYSEAHALFLAAGQALGEQVAAAATWLDPDELLVLLPQELAEAPAHTPADAYRKAIDASMGGVYPAPPVYRLLALPDPDTVIANCAATAGFRRFVDNLRLN